MSMIATALWWIVLGMLLGWMGSWVFNRTLRTRVPATGVPAGPVAGRRVQVPVERVVEVPIERVVERVVEVSVERLVTDAGAMAARDATIRALRALQDRLVAGPRRPPPAPASARRLAPSAPVVDNRVDRTVDDPRRSAARRTDAVRDPCRRAPRPRAGPDRGPRRARTGRLRLGPSR